MIPDDVKKDLDEFALNIARGLDKKESLNNSKQIISAFADGDDDGGLWISPAGKVIDTNGISHADFARNRLHVFGISGEDDNAIVEMAQNNEDDVADYEEFLIQHILGKGWTRVRVNGSDIFIDIPHGRKLGDRLSVAAMALLNIGVPANSKVMVEVYKDGKFISNETITLQKALAGDFVVSSSGNAELIESATAKQLLDGNDNNDKFSRGEHLAATKAQGDSEIMRCFANTLELRTKSEKFKSNQTYYRQWILFKDFKYIAKDKKIKFEDAVDYSLNFGDVNIRCSCKSQLYHGFSYMGDQLGYLYGLPREKRFPKRNNPQLQNTTCKHIHIALEHILNNKEKIIKMFAEYYKRLGEVPEDTMIAVSSKFVEKGEKEESIDDFFDSLDQPEGEEEEDDTTEIISSIEEGTGKVFIDTKLAEGNLPPDQQVKYAGDEEREPADEVTAENVADVVTDEEVGDLLNEIEFMPVDAAEEVSASYKPLRSSGKSAIFSMAAKAAFANNSYILGLRNGIIERFNKIGREATWTFLDVIVEGSGDKKLVVWKSCFKCGAITRSVVFKETLVGKLFIFVEGVLIGKIRQGMGSDDFKSKVLIEALGGLK